MTLRSRRNVGLASLGICALVVAGCLQDQRADQGLAASPNKRPTPKDASDNRDHLVGWYRVKGQERVIPVLKRAASYYAVCRGAEAPMTPSPEGLTWAITPSSMTGTTIGVDPATGDYYLAVFDSQAANFTDGNEGIGKKQPLERIEPPKWVDATNAPQPGSVDEFLGWYRPLWIPQLRFEVRRSNDLLVIAYDYFNQESTWRRDPDGRILTPLPDGLGLTGLERGGHIVLRYNTTLQRFEIVTGEVGVCMPLVHTRVAPEAPTPDEMALKTAIGIPAWH